MATHLVDVSRETLATWFDERYDDGFSWRSKQGAELYTRLRSKQLLFFRHAQSKYQVMRDIQKTPYKHARHQKQFLDAPLTELGKAQSAALGWRAARAGFYPQLILSSPLTRCLQTAALAFPTEFVQHNGSKLSTRVATTHLLPECVDSFGDRGRDIDQVIVDHSYLERFRNAMCETRFHNMIPTPRWKTITDDHGPEPFPKEDRELAKKRVALVWRLISELPHSDKRVAVFTHSKLVKRDYDIHMIGNGIPKFENGDFISINFC
eukprot:m.91507 g.91507  ORF g.91507 m.91507 type:complete len:265 (+) comp26476_c0_seq2:190-984(+)